MSDESSSATEFPDDSNEERPQKDTRALPFGAALSVLVWEDEEEVD